MTEHLFQNKIQNQGFHRLRPNYQQVLVLWHHFVNIKNIEKTYLFVGKLLIKANKKYFRCGLLLLFLFNKFYCD